MKDAITYAHDAGFFSFNVIGWKAEFERLIEAVRADAIADHIRDAAKMVTLTAEAAQRIEEALKRVINDWVAPDDFPFEDGEMPALDGARKALATIRAARAQEPAHPDDEAVDRFAAAMKVKLAKKRSEGRGGWEDKNCCSAEFLNELLSEHISKGDPVDVGNLAMMLWNRGERTEARAQADHSADTGNMVQEPVAKVVLNRANQITMQKPNGDYFDISKHVGDFFYAAPVRTKDLTPEEILNALAALSISRTRLDEARAVIAKDREKNK